MPIVVAVLVELLVPPAKLVADIPEFTRLDVACRLIAPAAIELVAADASWPRLKATVDAFPAVPGRK
tara:strand:- start:226 stop:426 length:201 start_codon:yes stop_codon:yes gene_type:complete